MWLQRYRCDVAADKLVMSEVCERVGVAKSTWRAYVARGQAPKPDGRHSARMPWWHESTIDEWMKSRPRAGS